jgi:hypothetical protein
MGQRSRPSQWWRWRWLVWPLLAAAALSGVASAADIDVDSNDQRTMILIAGAIEVGDADKFKQIAAKIGRAVVLLYSEGGDTVTALEIGRAIRLKGYPTAVANGFDCTSSCALIWLAGSPRLLAKSGRVGFQAAYVAKDGKLLESGVGNAIVGRYLTLLNLSEQAQMFATAADPRSIAWLTPDNAAEIGIEVTTMDDFPARGTAGGNGEAAPPPAPAPEKPFATVGAWEIWSGGANLSGGCYAQTSYEPDILLAVGIDLGHRLIFLNLGSPRLKQADPKHDYDMQVQFDRHPARRAKASIVDDEKISFLVMDFTDPAFMTEFMTSKQLFLRDQAKGKDKPLSFNLLGSEEAGQAILRCQNTVDMLPK